MTQEQIIARVQKLLALAESSNEHEAKIAADKANALMVEYNLTQQAIDAENDYIDNVISEDPYIRPHQRTIFGLIDTFFFVSVYIESVRHELTIDGRWKYRKLIRFVGTEANVQVATYVFQFLSRKFQELWLDYKRANGLGEKSRRSYYWGLYEGLAVQLSKTREKVQEEKGLVLVQDPGLQEFMESLKLRRGTKPSKMVLDDQALQQGFEDGKEIKISRGVDSSDGNKGKLLK